jgi:sugar lactone lactonase YvrE
MNVRWWALLFCLPTSCSTPDSSSVLQRALQEGGRRPTTAASLETRALGQASFTTEVAPTPLRGADGIACRTGEAFIAEAAVNRIRRLLPDGSLSTVSLPEELDGPTHLAFDAEGSLWVTATNGAALWKRTRGGRWSIEASNLPNLSGLVADQNEIYFSQCDLRGSVSRLSPSRETPETIADGLGCPGTPALFESTLLVPLSEAGEVWRINPSTGGQVRLAQGLHTPVAIRKLLNGEAAIIQSGNGRIVGLDSLHHESPTRLLKQLEPGINDLAICGKATLVTNAVWGSVERLRPFSAPPVTLVPGGLLVPQGATMWGNYLLIADGRSVKRFRDGNLSLIAARGITPGFSVASGIIIGGDNAAYISAPAEGRIYRLDLIHASVEEFSSGMDWPTSLARLWTGEIAVAETGSGQILKITSDGLLWPMTHALLSPLALTADRSRLLVTEPDGGRIVSLRENGAPFSLASELSKPVGIAQGLGGRTFVIEHGRAALTQRSSDGRLLRLLDNLAMGVSDSSHLREVPLVATPQGSLWLALPGNGSLLSVRP